MERIVRYRKAATGDVMVLDWEGEQILYQYASGETHYLNAFGAVTFGCLSDAPLGVTELRHRVLAESGLDGAEAASQGLRDTDLQRVLDRFVELGLAEAVAGSGPR
jgi:PqqD family protein of HPr-rel-A system